MLVPRWNTGKSTAWNLREVLGTKVDLISKAQDFGALRAARVRVVTPRYLLDILTSQTHVNSLDKIGLVVCEDLELMDESYEVVLSLLLHSSQSLPIRFVGICSSINDPIDLATWLRVPPEGCYSLRPSERDQALSITSQTFTIPHSAALFKAMSKPLYDTLRSVSQTETSIVFVPSRNQCVNCMEDLVRLCAVEMSMRGFLGADIEPEALEPFLDRLKNVSFVDGLLKGIGIWHEGLDHSDAQIILQLFVEGVVRVLIVPRDAAWSIPVRAGLVVAMGTQYIKVTPGVAPTSSNHSGAERQIVEYTLHELVRMQGRAVRHAQTGRFHIMCQAEHRDAYMRFLHDGLPLESVLVDSPFLSKAIGDLRRKGLILNKQDALDFLGFTFLSRRIETNPVYYDAPEGGKDNVLSRLVDLIFDETENGHAAAPVDGVNASEAR